MFSKFSKEQINKLGNSIRFLTKSDPLSKTKLLKLIYMLEEISIKKHGIPFFNFGFFVWKFGPIVPEIFVDFSSQPSLLSDYFERVNYNITCKGEFCDDEFSKNDIDILIYVNDNLKKLNIDELISLTHRVNSPWYNAAQEYDILPQLENGEINSTSISIDISSLINHDAVKKSIYNGYIEHFGNPIKNECECLTSAH